MPPSTPPSTASASTDVAWPPATGCALDGTTIEVRWPPRGSVPFEPPDTGTGINNVSAVLDLRFGARRLLLMGDVEEAIDPQLLAAGIADGRRLDLLKVAHHGSRTASTEAFLAALRPRVAVISAGTRQPLRTSDPPGARSPRGGRRPGLPDRHRRQRDHRDGRSRPARRLATSASGTTASQRALRTRAGAGRARRGRRRTARPCRPLPLRDA